MTFCRVHGATPIHHATVNDRHAPPRMWCRQLGDSPVLSRELYLKIQPLDKTGLHDYLVHPPSLPVQCTSERFLVPNSATTLTLRLVALGYPTRAPSGQS